MPECHKCRWNGKRSKRCIRCKGPSAMPVNHGVTHLSFDEISEAETAIKPNLKPGHVWQVASFTCFMRAWLRMSPKSRNILARVIADGSISRSSIARNLRIAPQAVQQRLIYIARKNPSLKTVLRLRMRTFRH